MALFREQQLSETNDIRKNKANMLTSLTKFKGTAQFWKQQLSETKRQKINKNMYSLHIFLYLDKYLSDVAYRVVNAMECNNIICLPLASLSIWFFFKDFNLISSLSNFQTFAYISGLETLFCIVWFDPLTDFEPWLSLTDLETLSSETFSCIVGFSPVRFASGFNGTTHCSTTHFCINGTTRCWIKTPHLMHRRNCYYSHLWTSFKEKIDGISLSKVNRTVYKDIDNLFYYELPRQFQSLPRDVNVTNGEMITTRLLIEMGLFQFSPMRIMKGDGSPSSSSLNVIFKGSDYCDYIISLNAVDYLVYQTLAESLISYTMAFKYVSNESYCFNCSKGDDFTIFLDKINSWAGLSKIEYHSINSESLRRLPRGVILHYLYDIFYQDSKMHSLLQSFLNVPILDSEGVDHKDDIGIPPVSPLCDVIMNLVLNRFDFVFPEIVLDQPHVRYFNQILIPVYGEGPEEECLDEVLIKAGLEDVNYTSQIILPNKGRVYLYPYLFPGAFLRLNKKGNVVFVVS